MNLEPIIKSEVSQREISYTNAYIQNLEKWYWRIYLHGSTGETDIENRLMDMGRGEERVRCMEKITCKLTLNRLPMGICCMAQETQMGLCINLEGWNGEGDGREIQKGGNICIPMADSCWGWTESKKIL